MQGEPANAAAASMARCLSETGCLVIRDPRVGVSDNETFLNLMERYFEQPTEVKMRDARPALHYQARMLSLNRCPWKIIIMLRDHGIQMKSRSLPMSRCLPSLENKIFNVGLFSAAN